MPFTEGEVERLARMLWEEFEGRRVTLDRRGRPNYSVVRALARRLLELAEGAGVRDPLHEIDWFLVLNPELSAGENIRQFTSWVHTYVGRRVDVREELDIYATELERYLSYLRRALEEAPPEEREGILEEIRRVEAELGSIRGARERPEERRARPPRKPAPRVPEKASLYPLEVARYRIERYVRERVPRTYRFDWTDLRVRVSHHREATDALRAAVEAIGGRVVSVTYARPPLVITVADFSDAVLPPTAPLPPDYERTLLWSKFSAILVSRGVDPSEYVEDFETTLAKLEGRPLEERQAAVERLAASVAPPAAPPVAPVVEALRREVEELRREIRELRREVAWRPKTAEEVRAVYEAVVLPEPRLVPRVDEQGHPYFGPAPEVYGYLRAALEYWGLRYFTSCPLCRRYLPGGSLRPTEWLELYMERVGVPAAFVDWLRRYARRLEEVERGAAPAE